MKEIYDKLNYYLNDICKYLEKEHPFLLENIDRISELNDSFLHFLESYSFDNETIQNNLTYDEVYILAREIIEKIDKSYLDSFDNLIQSGELDFSYDNAYDNSQCVRVYKDGKLIRQLININRNFNYEDVIILVHEFIHYTNGKKQSVNRKIFTEFLSIYFEFYAANYLIESGINKEKLDYLWRIRDIRRQSISLYQYEIILLAYSKFGYLDDDTITLLQKYYLDISKETFESECTLLCENLSKIETKNEDEIRENPDKIGYILADEFISHNYRYILGTFLAILARKYSNFNDIVNLNNHINDLDDKTVYDICFSIRVDLNDKDFFKKLFGCIEEYINDNQINQKKINN